MSSTYFFTVRLHDPRRSLLTDHIDLLRQSVRDVRAKHRFEIDGCVVLPNHLHMVWTLPSEDMNAGTRWGAIKGKFTRGLRQAQVISRNEMRAATEVLGHAGIWAPGYQSRLLVSEAQRQASITYCWGNPVKHGLVQDACDWPYSSLHRDFPRPAMAAE